VRVCDIIQVTLSLSCHIDDIVEEISRVIHIDDIQNRGFWYLSAFFRTLVWVCGTMSLVQHSFDIDVSGNHNPNRTAMRTVDPNPTEGVFAGLGASGIVVGFALQTTLKDAFACITIFMDRPFQVDDWIMIDNEIGQVRWVGLR